MGYANLQSRNLIHKRTQQVSNRELKQTETAAVNRQTSIQIQSDGCQEPTEFTWP